MRFRHAVNSSSLLLLAALAAFAACGGDESDATPEAAAEAEQLPSGVVVVTARDFAFEAPQKVPSGWTTFRFENAGAQEHFVSISRMPEGKTVDDYRSEVVGAFGSSMGPYYDGEVELGSALEALGAALPPWFGDVVFVGGPGLVSPGGSGETTIELTPGVHVMECYVKTPDGRFHVDLGMLREIVVTEETNGAAEPAADFDVTLANYVIDAPESVPAGPKTIRVRVIQDPEGPLKHDVHLIRVTDETDMEAVVPWMSWIDGMVSPAPATFVGGAEQMHAGSWGFVHVTLEPGTYAWISEGYAAQGMVKEFVVE